MSNIAKGQKHYILNQWTSLHSRVCLRTYGDWFDRAEQLYPNPFIKLARVSFLRSRYKGELSFHVCIAHDTQQAMYMRYEESVLPCDETESRIIEMRRRHSVNGKCTWMACTWRKSGSQKAIEALLGRSVSGEYNLFLFRCVRFAKRWKVNREQTF